MKLLSAGKKKQLILLTATPIHNTLMDLYHQLSLITAGDDTHFADLGITDLRRYFIAADRKQLAEGIEDIIRLLDELMIRRTRQFIIENYTDALLNGEPVRFPKRILRKVEYSLTQLFGGAIYKQVLDTIDQLNLVPYRADSYLITVEEKQKFEIEHRATLQKIGLLKRFESSVEAIRKSIERLEKFYNYFSKALDQNKILDSKTFHKILKEMREEGEENDEKFFEALEKASLLPVETPFQFILAYLKKAGAKSLEAIPLGRRSGKKSDLNGLVIFYREKNNIEGMHIVYYDFKTAQFDHYNDITWLFRKIESEEDEPLFLPIKGYEGFRQFNLIDTKARQGILTAVNAPLDARLAQKIKPKHQRELTQEILTAFNMGKVAKDKALPIYRILNQENLLAWEDDFAEYLDEYRRQQNIDALLKSLEQLFQKYMIEKREKRKPQALKPEDLEVVAYMFLSRPDLKDITLET